MYTYLADRDVECHLWIQACRRPDLLDKDVEQLKHVHVCSRHFEQRMYGKLLLKKSAVPTLNLPRTSSTSSSTQTDAPAALQVTASQGVQTDGGVIQVPSGHESDVELCDVFLPYKLSVVVKSHIAVAKGF